MSEFREQAIKDVAEAMGVGKDAVLFYIRPGKSSSRLATYAVDQREARLRERAALREIKLHSSSESRTHKIARAALEAVKEG